MISKIIHYCWFGGKPLPELAQKCIASWKKYCPDYEIKEWNENNYDLNSCDYVKEAYASKKYAFVSDYARFDILYRYGGIYFDTDVELIRPIDAIIEQGAFMGVEELAIGMEQEKISVAPGLGIAAESGMRVYKELLDFYNTIHFIKPDGTLNLETIVSYTTNILLKHGLRISAEIQKIDGITIYPKEYFNPCDMHTKNIVITEKTVSVHHYAGSWLGKKEKFKRFVRKIVGNRIYLFLYSLRRGKNEK
ncbi:MAG: glycosyl transferase [Clostridia bacterium]|nr:glycosyl transferase [Clostridia bacterium]